MTWRGVKCWGSVGAYLREGLHLLFLVTLHTVIGRCSVVCKDKEKLDSWGWVEEVG